MPRIMAGFRSWYLSFTVDSSLITERPPLRQRTSRLSKARREGSTVWLYRLDWLTPVDGSKWARPTRSNLRCSSVAHAIMVGTGLEPQALVKQMTRPGSHLRAPAVRRLRGRASRRVPTRTRDHGVRPEVTDGADFRGEERALLPDCRRELP